MSSSSSRQRLLWLLAATLLQNLDPVLGHGRLLEPVSRASAWRKGFPVPPDYTDNQGFCGGFTVQWNNVNQGRCGVCGDEDSQNPGEHEAPGIYATGTIVQRYTSGSTITVQVEITADHRGFFEFKVCPNEDFSVDKSQDCFDRYPLMVGPSFTGTKWYIPPPNLPTIHTLQVQLPAGLVCNKQCIFQWTYTAGNNWGTCADGSQGLGCGPQETFRACSDIVITGTGGPGTTTRSPPGTTTRAPGTTTRAPATTTTKAPSGGTCYSIPPWKSSSMDSWCNSNCNHVPSYCPANMCKCG